MKMYRWLKQFIAATRTCYDFGPAWIKEIQNKNLFKIFQQI